MPDGRLVDLGCGPGRLTTRLPELLGVAEVLGIDSSLAMLEEAATHAGPDVTFAEGDIATWEDPGAWDVVLANASLHWVPDHPAVLARWPASLNDQGQLAVQVPANDDHPSHLIAAEVAAEEPFASAFPDGVPPDVVTENVLAPEQYAVLLDDLGFAEQTVRLQVYGHHLRSALDVVEWVRGTTLTRFQRAAAARAVRGAGRALPAAGHRRARRPLAVLLPVQAHPVRRRAAEAPADDREGSIDLDRVHVLARPVPSRRPRRRGHRLGPWHRPWDRARAGRGGGRHRGHGAAHR